MGETLMLQLINFWNPRIQNKIQLTQSVKT